MLYVLFSLKVFVMNQQQKKLAVSNIAFVIQYLLVDVLTAQ